VKRLTKISRYRLCNIDNERGKKHSAIWAITVPVGVVLTIWICATTALNLTSGRLLIELAIQEYVQIKADIDKRQDSLEEL